MSTESTRATTAPADLPKLDDDDEVAFPNDSGLAVIHEARYWKLREYEERCEGAGVARDLDVEAERRAYIAACPDSVFMTNVWTDRQEQEFKVWLAARGSGDKANSAPPAEPEKKLAHGHRDDFYLMANARIVAEKPIHAIRSMPNWVFAGQLFATGSNSAWQICIDAGIDPDGYKIERAPSAGSAGTQTGSAPGELKADCEPSCGYIGADCNFPACKIGVAGTHTKESTK